MFVAVCDQLFGTSTSSCRKIVTPFSFPIRAVRFSHSTASKGDFFPSVNTRWKLRPFPAPAAVLSTAASVAGDFPLNACFTVAIRPSALLGPHSRGGSPLFYSSASRRWAALGFRVSAEAKRNCRFVYCTKAGSKKKPTVVRSYLCSGAKRQCSAAGRCFALSLTAGAPPQLRARSRYFALDFSLRTRTVSWPHTNLVESPTPVRLALPRPPNLDSQYQLWDISCQVKNAKYG